MIQYARVPIPRQLHDGIVIYSVGPDGVDNNGYIDPQRSSKERTDVGIRLWDVKNRGLALPGDENQKREK